MKFTSSIVGLLAMMAAVPSMASPVASEVAVSPASSPIVERDVVDPRMETISVEEATNRGFLHRYWEFKNATANGVREDSSALEKRQWTSDWNCRFNSGGPGFGALKRQQELFGRFFGRGSLTIPEGKCFVARCWYVWFGLCNLSLTTRREPDYARDRIWEKDPYNFDDCLSENSDPYVVYVFGSDRATVSWDFRDEVRYC